MKRRGYQRAIVAVARKMLVSMYHVLTKNEAYHEERTELSRESSGSINWRTQLDQEH